MFFKNKNIQSELNYLKIFSKNIEIRVLKYNLNNLNIILSKPYFSSLF